MDPAKGTETEIYLLLSSGIRLLEIVFLVTNFPQYSSASRLYIQTKAVGFSERLVTVSNRNTPRSVPCMAFLEGLRDPASGIYIPCSHKFLF